MASTKSTADTPKRSVKANIPTPAPPKKKSTEKYLIQRTLLSRNDGKAFLLYYAENCGGQPVFLPLENAKQFDSISEAKNMKFVTNLPEDCEYIPISKMQLELI